MITSAAVALIAWVIAFWMSTKKKLPLTMITSIIGSLALLIAFPAILAVKNIQADKPILWIVFLVGVILTLSAAATDKVPTAFVLLGNFVAIWALFRVLPTVPIAFEHLGQNLTKVGDDLWFALKTFYQDITT